MALLDGLFGPHEPALRLRAERAGVLAANLANADTPGYKARDLDFAAALATQQEALAPVRMAVTQVGHIAGPDRGPGGAELRYRMPLQPSQDGNTVESNVEFAAFGENAVRYQASLLFINRRIAGLETALTGQ